MPNSIWFFHERMNFETKKLDIGKIEGKDKKKGRVERERLHVLRFMHHILGVTLVILLSFTSLPGVV